MKQLRGLVETFRLADGRGVPIYVPPSIKRDDCFLMKEHEEPDPVAFALPGQPEKTRTVGPAIFCGELAYVDLGWTLLWLDAGCDESLDCDPMRCMFAPSESAVAAHKRLRDQIDESLRQMRDDGILSAQFDEMVVKSVFSEDGKVLHTAFGAPWILEGIE